MSSLQASCCFTFHTACISWLPYNETSGLPVRAGTKDVNGHGKGTEGDKI